MKKYLRFYHRFPVLLWLGCLLFIGGCKKTVIDHVNLVLTLPEKISDTLQLNKEGMVFLDQGNFQYLIRTTSFDNEVSEFEILKTDCILDSTNKSFRIHKMELQHKDVRVNDKTELKGTNGNIIITSLSVEALRSQPEPVGPCRGICCEATCFSKFCCSDQNECKNAPCNCPYKDCSLPPSAQALLNQLRPNNIHVFAQLFDKGVDSITVRLR